MYRLTKSMLLALHQCPLRFWRERHEPQLAQASSMATFQATLGNEVGTIARELLGPGVLIGHVEAPLDAACETQAHLAGDGPLCLFEAAFIHRDVLVRVDVLTRDAEGRYRLFEVKSSSRPKAHHVLDAAVQAWVLRGAGLEVEQVSVVHVDTAFVATEPGHFEGLLVAADVTADAFDLARPVADLVAQALALLDGDRPAVLRGGHCAKPHPCAFDQACRAGDPEYPIDVLPRLSQEQAETIRATGARAIADLVDVSMLNPAQQRWAHCIKTGTCWLDADAIRTALAALPWPRYYVDFETVGFAAPRWRGTRPREQYVFQWSLLIEHAPGELERHAFIAEGDACPVEEAVRRLLAVAGNDGPIIHYSDAEMRNLRAAKALVPALVEPLIPFEARMWDLLVLVRNRVVIPRMRGSHSIKAVHPALMGHDAYKALNGVHDGMGASAAYLRMTDPSCPPAQRERLREELRTYCDLDVDAMRDLVTQLSRRVGLLETEPA